MNPPQLTTRVVVVGLAPSEFGWDPVLEPAGVNIWLPIDAAKAAGTRTLTAALWVGPRLTDLKARSRGRSFGTTGIDEQEA